ncbi:hypothetical protein [Nostoc sp.]|uniref:hypothetical protein n=1 Tax=Nostoc sp. TaxID=1180 RepID=UPI002FF8A025
MGEGETLRAIAVPVVSVRAASCREAVASHRASCASDVKSVTLEPVRVASPTGERQVKRHRLCELAAHAT